MTVWNNELMALTESQKKKYADTFDSWDIKGVLGNSGVFGNKDVDFLLSKGASKTDINYIRRQLAKKGARVQLNEQYTKLYDDANEDQRNEERERRAELTSKFNTKLKQMVSDNKFTREEAKELKDLAGGLNYNDDYLQQTLNSQFDNNPDLKIQRQAASVVGKRLKINAAGDYATREGEQFYKDGTRYGETPQSSGAFPGQTDTSAPGVTAPGRPVEPRPTGQDTVLQPGRNPNETSGGGPGGTPNAPGTVNRPIEGGRGTVPIPNSPETDNSSGRDVLDLIDDHRSRPGLDSNEQDNDNDDQESSEDSNTDSETNDRPPRDPLPQETEPAEDGDNVIGDLDPKDLDQKIYKELMGKDDGPLTRKLAFYQDKLNSQDYLRQLRESVSQRMSIGKLKGGRLTNAELEKTDYDNLTSNAQKYDKDQARLIDSLRRPLTNYISNQINQKDGLNMFQRVEGGGYEIKFRKDKLNKFSDLGKLGNIARRKAESLGVRNAGANRIENTLASIGDVKEVRSGDLKKDFNQNLKFVK